MSLTSDFKYIYRIRHCTSPYVSIYSSCYFLFECEEVYAFFKAKEIKTNYNNGKYFQNSHEIVLENWVLFGIPNFMS